MRIAADLLKIVGAVLIATVLGHPKTYPPPGVGLIFFLGTFLWPIAFAPLVFLLKRGSAVTGLRLLEVPLLAWTGFMAWFAAGMDPGRPAYIMASGVIVYAIGAAWSDWLAWNAERVAASTTR